jgi:hypothetical protein
MLKVPVNHENAWDGEEHMGKPQDEEIKDNALDLDPKNVYGLKVDKCLSKDVYPSEDFIILTE